MLTPPLARFQWISLPSKPKKWGAAAVRQKGMNRHAPRSVFEPPGNQGSWGRYRSAEDRFCEFRHFAPAENGSTKVSCRWTTIAGHGRCFNDHRVIKFAIYLQVINDLRNPGIEGKDTIIIKISIPFSLVLRIFSG